MEAAALIPRGGAMAELTAMMALMKTPMFVVTGLQVRRMGYIVEHWFDMLGLG